MPRNTSGFHTTGQSLRNQVQLITYVDRLAGDLKQLKELLDGEWSGIFGGVHLLPFFTPIDGADAGFDPVDHTEVDSRLGDWEDVRTLGEAPRAVADLIVNHISSESLQFQGLLRARLRFTIRRDVSDLRPRFPFGCKRGGSPAHISSSSRVAVYEVMLKCGEKRLLWTTFTPQQIDIDVKDPEGQGLI